LLLLLLTSHSSSVVYICSAGGVVAPGAVSDTLQQGAALTVGKYIQGGAGGAYRAAYDNTGHLIITKTATNAQIFTAGNGSPNPGQLELQVGVMLYM
jgi:hypothetical protein